MLEVDITCVDIVGIHLRFLKSLVSESLFCSTTVGTKTALCILQLWLHYFAASFFKALGIQLSMESKQTHVPVVSAFAPVSHLVYGDDHPSLPIFLLSTTGHLTNTSQTKGLLSIKRFKHLRSDFTASCTLQSSAIWETCGCSDVSYKCEKWLVEIFSPTAKDVIFIAKWGTSNIPFFVTETSDGLPIWFIPEILRR